MPATFTYKVKDTKGALHRGEIEGSSKEAVIKVLRDRGLIPLGVEEKKSDGLQKELTIPGFSGRIKPKEVAVFSRQFATMINSGLSLLRSLNVLEQQTPNKALGTIIGQIRMDVEKGVSLSASLEKHPKAFNPLYTSMVKAGEAGGVLDETLMRLADTLEAQVALKSKIRSAMAYPVAVLSLVALVVTAMLIFIVPTFVSLYAEAGGTLPLPTRVLLTASNTMRAYWFIIFPGLIGATVGFRRWIKTPAGRRAFDALKLKVPVFGPLFHKVAISRFSRTLGVLVRSGVPILQAMDIVEDTSGNAVVAEALVKVKTSVREGESLADPVSKHAIFPPILVQMMAVGEETGALDAMLEKVSEFYDSEVETTVDGLTSLLEPLLIVFMGGTVGAILVALYLPMFNLVNVVQ